MIAVVCYKSGPVKQAVIILLESTIFKEPQARGQVEQLACSLKTLAAALAHVMQIPLSGVRGMLQLLDRDLQDIKINNTSISMMLVALDRV